MSYIVQRKDRFYVVAYDGLDPLSGRERRRWHLVGHDRDEAEQLAACLDRERDATPRAPTGPVTFGEFLTNTWIPHKRRQVRPTTAYRYAWFVDRYIQPTSVAFRSAAFAPITSTRCTTPSPTQAGVMATGSHRRPFLRSTQ